MSRVVVLNLEGCRFACHAAVISWARHLKVAADLRIDVSMCMHFQFQIAKLPELLEKLLKFSPFTI